MHCENLELLLRFISHVEDCAGFYAKSFAEIVINLSDNQRYARLDFIDMFSRLVKDEPPPTAWTNAVLHSKLYLTSEEKDFMVRFGCDLCSCSHEKIAVCAADVRQNIADRKEDLQNNVEKRAKANAAVCVSFGIMLIILLI